MGEPIEIKYFNWLCAKVLERKSLDYNELMEILFKTEFVWVVPGDKHRVEDALELREDFIRELYYKKSTIVTERPCSIFELLISFAKRAEFQTDIPLKDWFWDFIANLQLDEFVKVSQRNEAVIEEILYAFTWRLYDPSGFGGMFPMSQTQNDQTHIEIWYQFSEYLEDRGLI